MTKDKEEIIVKTMYLIRCGKVKISTPNIDIIKEFEKYYETN